MRLGLSGIHPISLYETGYTSEISWKHSLAVYSVPGSWPGTGDGTEYLNNEIQVETEELWAEKKWNKHWLAPAFTCPAVDRVSKDTVTISHPTCSLAV